MRAHAATLAAFLLLALTSVGSAPAAEAPSAAGARWAPFARR